MIEINLLPAGEKKRRAAGRPGASRSAPALPKFSGDPYMLGLGSLAVLLLVGMGFMYWRVDTGRAEVETRIEEARQDSVRFASTIQLVEAMESRQDTIESKIEVIRGVDSRRYIWPHILDEISRAVPPYTWLTKVVALDAPPPPAPVTAADSAAAKKPQAPVGPAFSLEGNTGSTQALTRFMKSLEASPFIREVTLVTSEQVSTGGRTYQKFTLEARYEVPDSSFVETVPVISLR
ncbi:MAG TPA: PilN domain-containing protein [Longimicrobiaceae bacterium]|nr:PilN domain-containing protein [Longimicrobiaceae bacterium]